MDTIQNYKCPCCTAPLVFDAETQNLICESCDNTFPLETMQQMAERLDRQEALVTEARIRNNTPSELIKQAFDMQKEHGWDTATTMNFLEHMADRAESGANVEEIWDAALQDLVETWENKYDEGWEMPWE